MDSADTAGGRPLGAIRPIQLENSKPATVSAIEGTAPRGCVPLAMLGYLPAWLAGLGMACSSLGVVLNAMRLSKTLQFDVKGRA